jgi:hypothetical protein
MDAITARAMMPRWTDEAHPAIADGGGEEETLRPIAA